MKNFEWSATTNQVFTDDYDTHLLEGEAKKFNKHIGTGFIMLAPSRTADKPLTINVTDQGRITWPDDVDSHGVKSFIHIDKGFLDLLNEQGEIYFGGAHPDYPLTLDMDIAGGGLVVKAKRMVFMTSREEVVTKVRNTAVLKLSAELINVYSKIEVMDQASVEIDALSILAGEDGISQYANSERPCFSVKSGTAMFCFKNTHAMISPFDFINNSYCQGIFNFETNGPNAGGFHFENLGVNLTHTNENLQPIFKNFLISIDDVPTMDFDKFKVSFPNNGRDAVITMR